MKRLAVLAAAMLVLLPGCARHYVIKMTNGVQITTASKPRFKGGTYYFKDASGQEQSVPHSRVQQIEPASRSQKPEGFFRPAPAQ